jgi:hypothetical protein
MFRYTFSVCSNLTGSIPSGLFGIFSGAPASNMFYYTFYNCSGLTGIDDGIWNLTGVTNVNVAGMFTNTFLGCTGITSASPSLSATNTAKIYEYFTNYVPGTTGPFTDCTNMTDYDDPLSTTYPDWI